VGGYSSSARANFTRLHFTAFAYPDEWDVAHLTEQKPAFFNEYISAYNPYGQQPAGKYGHTRPSSDVMLSYDATLALLTGTNIALSGGKSSITPTDLQHGLTQIMGPQALQGVSGPIEFGSNGDPINKPFVVLAVDTHGRIHEERLQGCLPQNCP
jgi:ABC-type branched-subunit amino acid transport system substrate-binding protein